MNNLLGKEGESDWEGSEDDRYKEWTSPDGSYQIFFSIRGGPSYGGTHMHEIELFALSKVAMGKTAVMAVQALTEPNDPTTQYTVCLEAITVDKDDWCFTQVTYASTNDGKRHPPSIRTYPEKLRKHAHLSDEQFRDLCIEEMRAAHLYDLPDLPPAINVEATVVAFIDQIKRLDFSQPVLIPKQQAISDASTSQ